MHVPKLPATFDICRALQAIGSRWPTSSDRTMFKWIRGWLQIKSAGNCFRSFGLFFSWRERKAFWFVCFMFMVPVSKKVKPKLNQAVQWQRGNPWMSSLLVSMLSTVAKPQKPDDQVKGDKESRRLYTAWQESSFVYIESSFVWNVALPPYSIK